MTFIQFAEEPSQEERIAKLRAELEKLGGSTTSLESMPADMEEEFLRHVLEYETAEPISLMRLLENSGLEIPAPDKLEKDALRIKLKEIIDRMAVKYTGIASPNRAKLVAYVEWVWTTPPTSERWR